MRRFSLHIYPDRFKVWVYPREARCGARSLGCNHLATQSAKNILRDCRGAALIEFVLVLPMFILMTFAAIMLLLAIFCAMVLDSAMADATRVAKVSQNIPQTVAAIRQTIQERSFGVMDPEQVIITTDLQVNFAANWQNAPAEACAPPDTGTCPCASGIFDDANGNNQCDIGPPPLALGAPGNLVRFVAFYKLPIVAPYVNALSNMPNGTHLISSATVIRNER